MWGQFFTAGKGGSHAVRRTWCLSALLTLAALLFSACGGAMDNTSGQVHEASEAALDAAPTSAPEAEGEVMEAPTESSYRGAGAGQDSAGFESSSALNLAEHKIIRRAEMQVETEDYDESIALVQRTVLDNGGFIEDMRLEGTPPKEAWEEGRSGQIVMRIPADKFDAALTSLRKGGQVVYETIQSENVGAQYRDTEAHIQSIETHLTSLDALMAKATKLEDMLRLEEEISRLRYEKEGLQSNLRSWDDLVSFSTVTLTLRELNTLAPVLEEPEEARTFTFGEEASYNFRSAWTGFVGTLRTFALGVLSIWPTLVILLALLILAVLLWRRAKKRGVIDRATGKPMGRDARERKRGALSEDYKEEPTADERDGNKKL